jgi:site-specific DNA-methyltransferase (adenine-specific)
MERFVLHQGDCVAAMRDMAEASVDAIVTDPPYHLTNSGGGPGGKGADNAYSRSRAGATSTGFMGMAWDGGDVAFRAETWAEALRVLKPGGHLLGFSGSRTYHRMVVAIEDAGFEIRDQIMWLYGSGFPKSRNLDGDWKGWGTALKPAHEPIVVARKPLHKGRSVAANMEVYGTGALNIDGCRVPAEPMRPNLGKGALPRRHESEIRDGSPCGQPHELGRWPANVIHDGSEEVVEAFPDAPGQLADASSDASARKTQNVYGAMRRGSPRQEDDSRAFQMKPGARRHDEGSAARFFYCAKAGGVDRSEGCEHLPQQTGGMASNTSGQHLAPRDEDHAPKQQGNFHPTVKPTELMRYLCRLVTPPGGLVLDPFMGSGSTGKAAVLEGFRFIGCELDERYLAIARARIAFAERVGHQPSLLEAA